MPLEALIGSVIRALSPIVQQQFSPVFYASEELQNLSRLFDIIKAFLNDAERKQVRVKTLQVLLQQLKDNAYEVEDLVDEWNTRKLREEIKKTNSMNQVSKCCPCDVCYFLVGQHVDGAVLAAQTWLFNLNMRLSMGGKLKKMQQKLDTMCGLKTSLGLIENNHRNLEINHRNYSLRDETSSRPESNPIFGRDYDKREIISRLIGESSREGEDTPQKKLPVIAITGMGGLGKTTLAKAVYNDERVKNHFNVRIWVSIYDDFDVKKITLTILKSANARDCESLNLDQLLLRLEDELRDRKFLLLLDDVWNEGFPSKWVDHLRIPLLSTKGSRVLITARSHRVAKDMESNFDCDLKELLDDDCWLLFKSIAFKNREYDQPLYSEKFESAIMKKLKGVPLCAKVVGGAMRDKESIHEWEYFLNNEIWEDEEVAENIFPALLLSYYDLSSELKQCFIFCSVFSKDHVIRRKEIIQLWMAHGFIKSEETGKQNLNKLVWKSLLQKLDNDERFDEDLEGFKLHDLLHDLAQYVEKNECSIFGGTSLNPTSLNKCRHSTLILSEGSSIFVILEKVNKLRTALLVFNDYNIVRDPGVPFDKLILLRALDLSDSRIKKLDGSIGRLIHLRYLNLTSSAIEELPRELTDLCNLQTLNLSNCRDLSMVPREISKMRSLRYFSVANCNKLTELPEGIGRLTSLRHLRLSNENFSMGIKMGELKELKNLQSLEMDGMEKVIDWDEVREAQLKEKTQLRVLKLYWSWSGEDVNMMERTLDGLHPPSNLSNLQIMSFPGRRLPAWMEVTPSMGTWGFAEEWKRNHMKDEKKRKAEEMEYDEWIRKAEEWIRKAEEMKDKRKGKAEEMKDERKRIAEEMEYDEWIRKAEEWKRKAEEMKDKRKRRAEVMEHYEWMRKDEEMKDERKRNKAEEMEYDELIRIAEERKRKAEEWERKAEDTKDELKRKAEEMSCLKEEDEAEEMEYEEGMRKAEEWIRKAKEWIRKTEVMENVEYNEWRHKAEARKDERKRKAEEMSCLKELIIWDCPLLEKLPPYLSPTLQKLTIWYCPLLEKLPPNLPPTLQILEIGGCHLSNLCRIEGGKEWKKIQHIPDLRMYDN